MTERLHFHFSLSCIGEGNGNPLQCSCLENPRDGGAWWATIYGVAQSQTQLKRLSSSSSRGEKGMNRQRTGAISGSETTSCAAVMVNTCPYRFVQTHRIYNKSAVTIQMRERVVFSTDDAVVTECHCCLVTSVMSDPL